MEPVIISTDKAVWRRGKKTQGLRAKPLITLIVDKSVTNKFLVDTLEGREPVESANIFCIGAAGDAWQQTSSALLRKYDVKSIDEDGWMVCEPKPENEVEFFEIKKDGYIQGMWGETIGTHLKLQRCKKGDFICRQPHDHADQWVVYRVLFNNTYRELGKK